MENFVAKRGYYIIAVDFDGVLYKGEDKWPDIGEANQPLIDFLKSRKQVGDRLILWTCRNNLNEEHNDLVKAVEWCEKHGLIFDAVNENIKEIRDQFQGDSRKIAADIYIDDKAVNNLYVKSSEYGEVFEYGRMIDDILRKTNSYMMKNIEIKCLNCGNCSKIIVAAHNHDGSARCKKCNQVIDYTTIGNTVLEKQTISHPLAIVNKIKERFKRR